MASGERRKSTVTKPVERLEPSWRGLEQMVRPDDDPGNIANHFSVDRARGKLEYTHHMMTLGAFRKGHNLIELNYLHYTVTSPSLKLMCESVMQGYYSLCTVQIHKAVVEEEIRDGKVAGLAIKSDEGKLLKECENGKICRVRNDSYPKEHGGKLMAVTRALKRCGEQSYKVALNNCEHLVTELLTGIATSLQAERRIFKAVAIDVTIFQIPSDSIKFFLKQLPTRMTKLGISTAPMIRSAFVDLFCSGLDEVIEYLIRCASITGTDFKQIVSRSKLNLASAAIVELCFLVVRTIYDIYAYKCGERPARLVAQNFLQGISGLVGTTLGTFFGGLLGALLLAPLGLAAGGLIVGNIAGGVVGGILTRSYGTKWLTNGRIEKHLVQTIEGKYKIFPNRSKDSHNDLLQQLRSALSPHSVGRRLVQM